MLSFVVKKFRENIFRIKAIVCFWTIKQKKIMTHVIKGRSDFSSGLTFPSEIKQEPH